MLWILPFIPALILLIVLPIIYRNRAKKDKGFQFVYYGLTYRRKFIRTLWTIPIGIIAVLVIAYNPVWSSTLKVVLIVLSVILFVAQLGYNYYKMKQTEE